MHCPQCGTRIESDDISYCTRCGQMLERIRAAMSDEIVVSRRKEVSRSGLNLGVGLMYAGLWPALLAVISSPSAIPAALLMLSVALIAIIFGSGPILRLFQADEIHPDIERARRKEIAFGSTLMYFGSILATLFVAVGVPDAWVRIMLVASITTVFAGLLAGSKSLYVAYRSLAWDDRLMLGPETMDRKLKTAPLDNEPAELQMPAVASQNADGLLPHSVTDATTRSLEERGLGE